MTSDDAAKTAFRYASTMTYAEVRPGMTERPVWLVEMWSSASARISGQPVETMFSCPRDEETIQ